jgi:hypothetical protein
LLPEYMKAPFDGVHAISTNPLFSKGADVKTRAF